MTTDCEERLAARESQIAELFRECYTGDEPDTDACVDLIGTWIHGAKVDARNDDAVIKRLRSEVDTLRATVAAKDILIGVLESKISTAPILAKLGVE